MNQYTYTVKTKPYPTYADLKHIKVEKTPAQIKREQHEQWKREMSLTVPQVRACGVILIVLAVIMGFLAAPDMTGAIAYGFFGLIALCTKKETLDEAAGRNGGDSENKE